MTKLLVLDFDGTMTDAEQEGAPFRSGYLEDLAGLTGRELEDIHRMAERYEAEVSARADEFGWMYEGRIVAPASVDPYLRIMPVARMILDECNAFTGESDRDRLLDAVLYKYNYQKTRDCFKPGARELLESLQDSPIVVVTNSPGDVVQKKITALGGAEQSLDWLAARVYGRARKYMLDNDFTQVPESLSIEGLARPILLRRKHYYDVLDELRHEASAQWSDIAVVGDIFELDLSLPIELGARVGIIKNQFTPTYEISYLQQHERGIILDCIEDIRNLL